MPILQRLRGLDVVVPIEQNREGIGRDEPARIDQGLPPGLHYARIQAGVPHHFSQEAGAFPDAEVLGADARLPYQGEQRVQIRLPVALDMVEKIVQWHIPSACSPLQMLL